MAPKFSRSYGKFQGYTGQKNIVKWVKLGVFGHFLENICGGGGGGGGGEGGGGGGGGGAEIPYADVTWPPDSILITVCWFY